MGTNFYLVNGVEKKHIGKRSLAGSYCWVCYTSLESCGEDLIHSDVGKRLDKCPNCTVPYVEGDSDNRVCFSFTWDMPIAEFLKLARKKEVLSNSKGLVNLKVEETIWSIYDEYNVQYSLEEFFDSLEECPIMFFINRKGGKWHVDFS